jgi:ABC-2 type transport system ATP-binding protein
VHSPSIVFLDEPTTGLDPQSRANLWQHIRSLRDDLGVTVFLTTHYLDEADALCDRLLVIDNGTIVAAGTPEELKRAVSGDAVTLTLKDGPDADGALLATEELPGAQGAVKRPVGDGTAHVQVRVPNGGAALPGLLRTLDARGISPDAVEVRRPTLDDVFLSLTGRSLRDAA